MATQLRARSAQQGNWKLQMNSTPHVAGGLLIIGCAITAHLQLSTSALAQEPSADETVCMVRPQQAVAQVRASDRGKNIYVLAATRSIPGLKAKGFRVVDCTDAKLAQTAEREAYRDRVCELAATGNQAVQEQLGRALGERPAVLCANAELAVGAWAPSSAAASQ